MTCNTETCKDRDLLTFNEIKNEIISLCTNGKSGDLCLFTEEKHAAVISLFEGKIVGLRYRISRGNDALRLIKSISKAKMKFQKSNTSTNQMGLMDIPSTQDILKILGVELKDNTVQEQEKAKKILVVEDSRTQRKVICRMLIQNGYQIAEANDGYEALAKLDETKPDLILLDIIMPGIDGYKVMSLIKGKPGMEDVPIIMLTSRSNLIDKMRGKVSGTDEYLTKPFKYEELIGKIDKYLYTENNNTSFSTPVVA